MLGRPGAYADDEDEIVRRVRVLEGFDVADGRVRAESFPFLARPRDAGDIPMLGVHSDKAGLFGDAFDVAANLRLHRGAGGDLGRRRRCVGVHGFSAQCLMLQLRADADGAFERGFACGRLGFADVAYGFRAEAAGAEGGIGCGCV